ncbi:MAG: DUF3450 family protein [Candidatus Brocadiia bacterium]
MKHRFRSLGFSLLVLLFAALVGVAYSEESGASGAVEVRALVERLESLRAQKRDLLDTHARRSAEIGERVSDLKKQLDESKGALASLTESLNESVRKASESEAFLAEARGFITGAASGTLPVARRIRERIASGIAFNRDSRVKALDAVLTDMASGDTEKALSAFSGFWAIAENELKLSVTIDMWNAPVHIAQGDRILNSWQVRLGTVGHFFISEDRSQFGISSLSRDSEWDLDPPSALDGILSALDIMQRRRYPELVKIYLIMRPAAGGR